MYLRTLRRMLLRSNFAIRAPVAVVYEGGGVYFGGESSSISDGLLSSVTAMAGIDDEPVCDTDCLLFTAGACADRASGYL